MSNNPLFRVNNSPTNTTKPTKAVNQTSTSVRRTHNTFDNSYFNFMTQRFGLYEPFWWKTSVAGDSEPYSNSHNVRSLPFASAILSPMKLNKDYFQVPHYAIQPNTWDYIFKSPSQGDDVPLDAQNLFPLFYQLGYEGNDNIRDLRSVLESISEDSRLFSDGGDVLFRMFFKFLFLENFLSSGSLLYKLGFKINPIINDNDGVGHTFDEVFDAFMSNVVFSFSLKITDVDSPNGYRLIGFNIDSSSADYGNVDVETERTIDRFTALSLLRSHMSDVESFSIYLAGDFSAFEAFTFMGLPSFVWTSDDAQTSEISGINCIRMDVLNAYQLACAQYYVNPRVDFLYNAQLYRDNWISILRNFRDTHSVTRFSIGTFEYNGIPVLYDYFSSHYYRIFTSHAYNSMSSVSQVNLGNDFREYRDIVAITYYLFGFREQLRFGDYFTDARTQALGYGEPGSDVVNVMDDSVSVTDLSQKLVLNRFRSAVAHLDNSAEDYLKTMYGEDLPPDYHYPKFIVHSEFGIDGQEISNTTSDDQGNIVTNLKSGVDSAEFNISVSVPSILIGISYVSIPRVYSQIKERHYFHEDRYDMFQPMLQYFGDQEIYNREKSDYLDNPQDSYAYVSRNGEYKQRLSQCSGAFLTSLRSWIFVADPIVGEGREIVPIYQQSPLAIRAHDFEFNRFLKAQSGLSLGTGFHFIMQYNNKNVDNRPMEVNPLPLYPNNSL